MVAKEFYPTPYYAKLSTKFTEVFGRSPLKYFTHYHKFESTHPRIEKSREI